MSVFYDEIIASINETREAVKNITANNLAQMNEEELEELLKSMPKFEAPSDQVLSTMDVGIYDNNGDLIGIKEGHD